MLSMPSPIYQSGSNGTKLFLSVIYEFSYYASVFLVEAGKDCEGQTLQLYAKIFKLQTKKLKTFTPYKTFHTLLTNGPYVLRLGKLKMSMDPNIGHVNRPIRGTYLRSSRQQHIHQRLCFLGCRQRRSNEGRHLPRNKNQCENGTHIANTSHKREVTGFSISNLNPTLMIMCQVFCHCATSAGHQVTAILTCFPFAIGFSF